MVDFFGKMKWHSVSVTNKLRRTLPLEKVDYAHMYSYVPVCCVEQLPGVQGPSVASIAKFLDCPMDLAC